MRGVTRVRVPRVGSVKVRGILQHLIARRSMIKKLPGQRKAHWEQHRELYHEQHWERLVRVDHLLPAGHDRGSKATRVSVRSSIQRMFKTTYRRSTQAKFKPRR